MAAAARPGPPEARDARVPCPLCGGLIHPIAGKCKHCKADLGAYRATRPAANTPLPALHPAATTANGLAPPVAHAVAMPAAAQPVLPPRPTAHATAEAAGSAWRSWPAVVIVVAMMAIVAAVVLMVWPSHRDDGKHTLQPPPAPERMDTRTPPITPRLDSHPAPQGGAPADPPGAPHASLPGPPDPPGDPTAQAAQAAQAAPASDDDPDADPGSPSPSAAARRGHPALTINGGNLLQVAMAARLCRKLVQCGTTDDMMRSACERIAAMPADPPAGCPAAERCLRHIDAMGCSSQPDALQVGVQIMQLPDCVDAMRC